MFGLLAPVISCAAFAEILSQAELCVKLSRPLVLGFGLRPECILAPEDLQSCCITEVEAEARLKVILEPDYNSVVLINLVSLGLYPPPLY